ncbi:DUF362 domain-containing protein [Parabacteroides acidifaciens]|uniref:DUF362 domain-containing protein n=1 Tax=Parabacteroides acidifaciens TaxID=2290935 RepID=A0A3D8HJU0_9BACT|nr:DUF362 domain-containing protein [Parabacteroides acidifaciens]MBC8600395.1 DUF362 domain-containing protein [Parabacteroides acidifaciens]RDU51022.1 DUF362 domain-containing protein [Parabacteroides acidifaciens]
MQRRNFFRSIALGGMTAALSPIAKAVPLQDQEKQKPATNINEATAIPRTAHSMPGKYPGKVVKTSHPGCIVDGQPSETVAYEMLKTSMLNLTGQADLRKAWLEMVGPQDIIGLKVNPIAGKLLSTSHAVTRSIIKQLEEAGIPRKNLIIWDRREEDLKESGFTEENYPGIKIIGTEYQDADGSYIDKDGKFYGESRIDKSQSFFVDLEGEYDAYTMPYMINGGKHSYFTKICTEMVTKIINVPVIKNAGSTITVCMKNLAFGSITNTARLHGPMWHDTCACACAFPPLRDKVVLNIADGLTGCFDGGPSANPQFICHYNTLVVGTDPVATDRICYDIVLAKRIEEGIQDGEKAGSRAFMETAQELKLGVADKDKIELKEINLQA